MATIKKFKPKNLDQYVELKPGIWARKDRLNVPITQQKPKTRKSGEN